MVHIVFICSISICVRHVCDFRFSNIFRVVYCTRYSRWHDEFRQILTIPVPKWHFGKKDNMLCARRMGAIQIWMLYALLKLSLSIFDSIQNEEEEEKIIIIVWTIETHLNVNESVVRANNWQISMLNTEHISKYIVSTGFKLIWNVYVCRIMS